MRKSTVPCRADHGDWTANSRGQVDSGALGGKELSLPALKREHPDRDKVRQCRNSIANATGVAGGM